jgi:copper chaperone CopZ
LASEVQLTVEGMSCAGCEVNLRFALSSLPGVERTKADYRLKLVEVAFDPALTSKDEVRRAIEEIGYTVVTSAV